MKRIITLLIAAALVVPALAQNGFPNDKRYDNGRDGVFTNGPDKRGGNDFYYFSKQERDYQIAQINRNYDQQINSVKHKMFMNRYKKETMMRQLEDQRREEIRKINMKFNDRRNRWDDKYGRNDRNDRNDRRNW